MARHESGMHRQRRELLEAMEAIMATDDLRIAKRIALDAVFRCVPPCNIGLFAEHQQLDLQDRRDV